MFKSFVKKFEETTGSIKDSVLGVKKPESTPTPTPSSNNNNDVVFTTSSNQISNASTSPPLSTSTSSTTQTTSSLSTSITNSVQPMVEVLKDSFKTFGDVDALKEFTEKDIPKAFSTMTTNMANSVVVTGPNPNLPSIAQLKESLNDVDLYNGTLLLRSYEIKLKQIRTNGSILADRAEEVDKKLIPLVKNCSNQMEFWKRAHAELSKLDELNNMVESIGLTLESLVSKIEAVEIDLSIEIENYLDNDLAKWKEKKESDFNRYENMKKNELIKIEEDLINAHNRHEREQQLKERLHQQEQERLAKKKQEEEIQKKLQEEARIRSSLDKTIQQQMNDYKESGIIPNTQPYKSQVPSSANSTTNPTTTTTIDQIVIEDSKDDLEKFLEPSPVLNSSNNNNPDNNNSSNNNSNQEDNVKEEQKEEIPPILIDETNN